MPTKDDQEGRVKNAILPTTPTTTAETAGSGAAETRNDDSWKQNFPQAAEAGASREEYQQTADQARVQAERAANMEAAAKKERDRQATINDEPVPTGESANPHEGEEASETPKHGEGDPLEHEPARNREPGQQQ